MSQIELDERFGGSYQFVRKDELVVSVREIKISILGKITAAIMSLVVGLCLSLIYMGWERYEAVELKKKRHEIERVLNFHETTSILFEHIVVINEERHRDQAISILSEMINEANTFRKYSSQKPYFVNSEYPGLSDYPLFDDYQKALSQTIVYVHSGEGDLENILITLVETREQFLREYSKF